uniref:Methyltransferase gidB, putative n=1 Tax=Arundo donax TaxID=35708 RepID=A0A0A9E8K6_ARUDO
MDAPNFCTALLASFISS